MFRFLKIENTGVYSPEPEYIEATASEAIAEGEALVLASGKLTKCGATVKPAYIAAGAVGASATDRKVAAVRVTPDMVFAAPVSASPASLIKGVKVTIHSDGLGITATTTSGVATVVDLCGAAAQGDEIHVRFE